MKVYLPGVFDLFHIGHLRAVVKAKRLGTYLIVGVQEDKSVYEQKGYHPAITTKNRKRILRALKYVNKTISYKSSDQSQVLMDLKPDIFAVNETYGSTDPDQKKTLETAKRLGVKVVRILYLQGISTTQIKDQIKNGS